MKAYEIFILDLFLRLQKRFSPVYHKNILSQVYKTYGPLQWNLLSLEDQCYFRRLEVLSEMSQATNKILMPVFIEDKLNFIEVDIEDQVIEQARNEAYSIDNQSQAVKSLLDSIIPLKTEGSAEDEACLNVTS